jgi:hypothetical protein
LRQACLQRFIGAQKTNEAGYGRYLDDRVKKGIEQRKEWIGGIEHEKKDTY